MRNTIAKQKLTFVLLIIILFALNSCAIIGNCPLMADKNGHHTIIIDVRTTAEFDSGHLNNALNIPYDIIEQQITDVTCCKSQEIIVYCRRGGRAETAKATLRNLGYSHVVNAGGYEKIRAAGNY